MHQLWHKQLREIHADFELYFSKMQSFKNPEDLHQARIAMRKTLTITAFLKNHTQTENHTLEQFYDKIKSLANITGTLRDYDVMLQYLEDNSFKVKGKKIKTKVIYQTLKREQLIERQHLMLDIPLFYDNELQQLWTEITNKKNLKKWVKNVELEKDFEKLQQKFDKRHLKYLTYKEEQGATQPETVAALHKLRLQSKKLRYSYMYLGFALPKNQQKNTEKYKKMQTYFGEINDLYNLHECLLRLESDYPYLISDSKTLTKHITNLLENALENVRIKKPNKQIIKGLLIKKSDTINPQTEQNISEIQPENTEINALVTPKLNGEMLNTDEA